MLTLVDFQLHASQQIVFINPMHVSALEPAAEATRVSLIGRADALVVSGRPENVGLKLQGRHAS